MTFADDIVRVLAPLKVELITCCAGCGAVLSWGQQELPNGLRLCVTCVDSIAGVSAYDIEAAKNEGFDAGLKEEAKQDKKALEAAYHRGYRAGRRYRAARTEEPY